MPRHGSDVGGTVDIEVKVSDGVTLSDLGSIIKGLDKKAASVIRKRLRDGINDAGTDLSAAVAAQASWSTRIPRTVKLKTSFGARSAGVTVTAGGPKAPHARPLEHGGKAGTLRHPVFADKSKPSADWAWVNQPARPFFFVAVDKRTPAIGSRIQQVMDDVAKDLGFTGK